MKLGIVTEYYYPLLGGISENVHNTAIRLHDMGWKVKIITSHCNGNGRIPVHSNGVEVIRLGRSVPIYSNSSFARLSIGRSLRTKLGSILKAESFDILHLHSPIVLTLPSIALVEAECPVVGTFHTYFQRSLVYAALKGTIQRAGINKMAGQIAVSQKCVEALSRYFKLRPRVIPNGIDINQFSPEIKPLDKFNDGKLNLLFLGRFDPRNGLALMIKAFETVKRSFENVRLIIVGDGLLGPYYKRLVPPGLKQDIHFEGSILEERPNYYASCHIFCSPVSKASFGITLLEAMASAKPIIATENEGYKDLLGREEAVIVPPGDHAAFAQAIIRLLRNQNLRSEMGEAGRQKALQFSWDRITWDIAKYYQEILSAPQTIQPLNEKGAKISGSSGS